MAKKEKKKMKRAPRVRSNQRCIVTDEETGKQCPKPIFIAKHKLCSGHYKQLCRLGTISGLLRPRRDLSIDGPLMKKLEAVV